jgi:hypothetical protein
MAGRAVARLKPGGAALGRVQVSHVLANVGNRNQKIAEAVYSGARRLGLVALLGVTDLPLLNLGQ